MRKEEKTQKLKKEGRRETWKATLRNGFVTVPSCNLAIQEAEAGELEASLDYIARLSNKEREKEGLVA